MMILSSRDFTLPRPEVKNQGMNHLLTACFAI